MNIEALIARFYATAYPWAGCVALAGMLPGSGPWMAWPVGDVPAVNDQRF